MANNNGHIRSDAVVTVIISAYQRPQVLNKALESLYRQHYRSWRAFVIADCCPEDFFSAVDRSDDRVSFINLPIRCGHQYGPNSVGIHLADTEFLAYLNHDDLWLADHLQLAVQALQQENADAYLGRAAFCTTKHQSERLDRGERPMFSELNRPELLWRCMSGPFYFFEPASAWVVRTELAKRVGYWQPPDEVKVTPVMDWLMRLAGAGASFHVADEVSVLKLHLQRDTAESDIPTYFQDDPGLTYMDGLLNMPEEQLRAQVAEDIAQAAEKGLRVRHGMHGPVRMNGKERDRVSGFLLYLQTGIISSDLVGPAIGPYKPDKALKFLAQRTGEHITGFTPVGEVLAALQASDQER